MNVVLPDILSDSILTDDPAATVNASVVLNTRFSSVPCVLLSAVENPLTPVILVPSPVNDVAVIALIPEIFVELSPTIFPFAFILPAKVPVPPLTLIPALAVTIPIESTFATSS